MYKMTSFSLHKDALAYSRKKRRTVFESRVQKLCRNLELESIVVPIQKETRMKLLTRTGMGSCMSKETYFCSWKQVRVQVENSEMVSFLVSQVHRHQPSHFLINLLHILDYFVLEKK